MAITRCGRPTTGMSHRQMATQQKVSKLYHDILLKSKYGNIFTAKKT